MFVGTSSFEEKESMEPPLFTVVVGACREVLCKNEEGGVDGVFLAPPISDGVSSKVLVLLLFPLLLLLSLGLFLGETLDAEPEYDVSLEDSTKSDIRRSTIISAFRSVFTASFSPPCASSAAPVLLSSLT